MCCSLQRGYTWVRCQPWHSALLAPKPQCPKTLPVVVLLQRAPLVPELPDTLLAFGELLCQPPLLPTPLAQLCFSLPCPGAGSQERLLHPRQLWGQRARRCRRHPTQPVPSETQTWDAGSPNLGRGGHAGAAGSGCPRAEPGSPRSAAALALKSGHRHRWATLQRGTGAESLSPTPLRAQGERFLMQWGTQSLDTHPLTPGSPGPSAAPYRWVCPWRPGGVPAAPGAGRWCRWIPPGAGAGCGSPPSVPPAGLPLPQPRRRLRAGMDVQPASRCPHYPAPYQSHVPEPFWCRVSSLFPYSQSGLPPWSATRTLPVSFWLEGYPDGRAP